MKRIFYTLFLFYTAAVIVCLRCTESTVAGGGTIETTNGIVGFIFNSDTKPASDIIVKLFPDDYDPVDDSSCNRSFIDTTDANGMYRFSSLTAGRYVVLAQNCSKTTNFLARDIMVNDDSITKVLTGTLDQPCLIIADFSSGGVAGGGYLYIPGTDIFSSIRSDGSAMLDNVPPGTITTVILATIDNEKRNILRNEITIAAGDTVTIDQPLWKYSRHISLNTTPAGADVYEDVYNFPVLIRLNSGNFDFSQASINGEDLVFTCKRNIMFRHQIERWNAVAEHAEIWVNVDTIHGNDSVQSITMYWGNSAATKVSNSADVFDTANGFQGVWHFSDGENGQMRDATVNGYHGTSPDSSKPSLSEGVTGNCRVFDGSNDYIIMPNTADSKLNFPVDGYYTISAWVFLDTFDNLPHLIVAKGYDQYFMRFTYFPSNSPVWEFVELNESASWQACTTTAMSKQWTLLTGVRLGNSQLLYCNGVLVDSIPNSYAASGHVRNSSDDLMIGKFMAAVNLSGSDDSFCFFKGSIDEVRILSRAQSPGWIRLCYMNQRIDDRLVAFR